MKRSAAGHDDDADGGRVAMTDARDGYGPHGREVKRCLGARLAWEKAGTKEWAQAEPEEGKRGRGAEGQREEGGRRGRRRGGGGEEEGRRCTGKFDGGVWKGSPIALRNPKRPRKK